MTQPERSSPSPSRSPPPAAARARLAAGWAVALAFALACAHGPGEPPPLRTRLPDAQALSHGAPTLWQRFEAEEGRPRLLVMASPT